MVKDPAMKDVRRVADAVRERRESLGLSQDLSPYGGPKRNLVGGLETRGTWPRLPATRARWARALGWEPTAFDKLLKGEEPEELAGTVVPLPSWGSPSPEEIERARQTLDAATASHQVSGGSLVQERMITAEAAMAMMDRALDDARQEFIQLLRNAGIRLPSRY